MSPVVLAPHVQVPHISTIQQVCYSDSDLHCSQTRHQDMVGSNKLATALLVIRLSTLQMRKVIALHIRHASSKS